MKHTKGTWQVSNLETAETVFYIGGETGAIGSVWNKGGGEGEANAKLVASSPDLLEALQTFVDSIDLIVQGQKDGDLPDNDKYSAYKRIQESLTYQTAKQAISKATKG